MLVGLPRRWVPGAPSSPEVKHRVQSAVGFVQGQFLRARPWISAGGTPGEVRRAWGSEPRCWITLKMRVGGP